MIIYERKVGKVVVLDIVGPVTDNNHDDEKFEAMLMSHIDDATVVVNMRQMQYMDLKGFGVLLRMLNAFSRKGNRFVLTAVPKLTLDSLEYLSLVSFMDIHDSVETVLGRNEVAA